MMLTVDDVQDYLINEGLVSIKAITHGDLRVESAFRRNKNLKVMVEQGPSYLIKQPEDVRAENAGTLRNEARFYQYCSNQGDQEEGELQDFLPGFYHFNEGRALLVTELLDDVLPLWEYYETLSGQPFPTKTTAQVGKALAALHLQGWDKKEEVSSGSALEFIPSGLPWTLDIHRPNPYQFSQIGKGVYQLLHALQNEEGLFDLLEENKQLWTPNTLVHGDVKMDNFLVREKGTPGLRDDVYLVDWELVQWGDPAWDLGASLMDFVYWWVLSMPNHGDLDQMAAQARFPLHVLQPAIRALWKHYSRTLKEAKGLSNKEINEIQQRAVRFSANRIFQTAYEFTGLQEQIPPRVSLLLQIGINLLKDPVNAQVELYGLFQRLGV